MQAWILAVGAFADVVDRLPPDGWDQPALGDWCLRDLVGHTCSAGISAVVAAVEDPREKEDICSSEGYYALAKTVDPAVYQAAVAASTDDARRTGAELGVHPADAVRRLVDQAEAKLAGARGDLIVDTAGGGMRLSVWLPTRTFELVVHHLDIAAATGIPTNLPDAVVADCAALAARIASAVGDGPSVLLALTGRAWLPETFSVV